jgi:hypothetical protein
MEPKILEEIGKHYKQEALISTGSPFENGPRDMEFSIPSSDTSFPYSLSPLWDSAFSYGSF